MSSDRTFALTYLGRFTVHNFGHTSSDEIHHQLVEYYIGYLKQALDNHVPFNKLEIQNPIESRLVSLEDDCLSVRSWRYRRYDTKGTLINERDVYKVERIVLCDCLCFEVVQSASQKHSGVCYAYLRRASDSRYTIPESNLHELDRRLSAWLLKYRRFPRPPLVVLAIRRGYGDENSVDLLVFFAPNLAVGLDFVRSVTEMTLRGRVVKPPQRRRRGRSSSPLDIPRGLPLERPTSQDRSKDLKNRSRPQSANPMQQHGNLFGRPNHCPCSCCQSMGLLPSVFTSRELERVQNRIMQYRLGQEAMNHAYNRRVAMQNYQRQTRQATGGIQAKLRSRSCTGPNEPTSRPLEHNI